MARDVLWFMRIMVRHDSIGDNQYSTLFIYDSSFYFNLVQNQYIMLALYVIF